MSRFSNDQLAGYCRQLAKQNKQFSTEIATLRQAIVEMQSRPRSVEEEIDAIEGRRIEGVLSGEVTFNAAAVGNRAAPVILPVSQDGPFVMTHYPLVLWRPTAPDDTPNLNRWRPVSSFPLPDQVVDTDIIDLMYEMQDGGNGRLFQNAPRAPLFSRPDNIVPCPVPTLFSPNATITFIPTYLSLTWNGDPAPTEGTLHVDLIGYRIVNL